jgi:TonB-dependent SusC/RagA subfamily outer membrane receptor
MLFSCSLIAQTFENNSKESHYTYIFKLTDDEAEKLYQENFNQLDSTFFHTLVDSFITENVYEGNLEPGHYIKAKIFKNILEYSLSTVQDFKIEILDNSTDLLIQVFDDQGKVINNADLSIKGKKLRFDKKLQAYKEKKSNKKGLLKVKYNGLVCYYQLDRELNNPKITRLTKKIVWGTPIRIVWRPIRYAVMLPIDGVKSLIHLRKVGTINRTYWFFRYPMNTFNRMLRPFNNFFDKYSFDNRYTSLTLLNQPKYKPGDTVRFKTYIANVNGKPLNKTIQLKLGQTLIKELKPYHKGGYADEFVLHDSLNLMLDRSYPLFFKPIKKKYGHYSQGNFHYEEYELKSTNLKMKTNTDIHYKNNDLSVFLKGTDENDLNLQDARYELYAVTNDVYHFYDDYVFVPDTLFVKKGDLKPEGETEIRIPDSIFPKANLKYTVNVTMLTSDNEKKTASKTIPYYWLNQEIKHSIENDSVKIWYEENGIKTTIDAELFFVDNMNTIIEIDEKELPLTLKLQAHYSKLQIETKNTTKTIALYDEASPLKFYTKRNKDSLNIYADNPAKLKFSYFLYKRNREVARGYIDSLNFTKRTPGKANYLLSVQYMWGGDINSENYSINYKNEGINIELIQPELVYPGQTTSIKIKVSDNNGKPLNDADLTAFAITSKFNYYGPQLPSFKEQKERKGKNLINSFHFNDFNTTHNQELNYEQWREIAGLDSMEYYKFIYPDSGIYKTDYTPTDRITQFSPYVVDKGGFEKVFVIYVDDKPAYFGWMTNVNPYSVEIDGGYHRIKIRTQDRLIVCDSIFFEPGKKTIFSVQKNFKNKDTKQWNESYVFSADEQNRLKKHIFPYRFEFGISKQYLKNKYAYINQDKKYILLNSPNFMSSNLAGPVRPGEINFKLIEGFDMNFWHEENFEYDFLPSILKMREKKTEDLFPLKLQNISPVVQTNELVMTKEEIYKRYDQYINKKINITPLYLNPDITYPGFGSLIIKYYQNELIKDKYVNIVLFKMNDPNFIRVYHGNTTTFNQLERGSYQLVFLYPDSSYLKADSIEVNINGWNFLKISKPKVLKKDNFSAYAMALIRKNVLYNTYESQNNSELIQINERYRKIYDYSDNGNMVQGYVCDEYGEPLPGVSILVKGTKYGTMTDINGFYAINTPYTSDVLIFSYIGCETQEQFIHADGINDVVMAVSDAEFEEVVVTALGISRGRKSVAYSVNSIEGETIDALTGKVAGVEISNQNDPRILMRGISSITSSEKPLIIIDGKVFTGDLNMLDPELIKELKILKSDEATALYGSKAINGVILINTKTGTYNQPDNGNAYDESFFDNISEVSKLRTNFSDYAFWQPKLRTDKNGCAEFKITFPDDITKWNTHVFAVSDKKQTGKITHYTKSYKPLAARLALPNFLVIGDTAYAIGKSLNYLPDSANISTSFYLNDTLKFKRDTVCKTAVVDTLMIHTGKGDTLKVKYLLNAKNGYFDGEERKINVFPIGMEKALGNFSVLDKDTIFQLNFNSNAGPVKLYAKSDALDILDTEIGNLMDYLHECNEQMASKLKAMLADKQISTYKGRNYQHDLEVKKIIRKLSKNQNEKGLWGWWGKSNSELWISTHVLEALLKAEEAGYDIKIDKQNIINNLEHQLEKSIDYNELTIPILKLFKTMNAEINYAYYIQKIEESYENKDFLLELKLTELKQKCGLAYQTDWLKKYRYKTFFGNTYYSSEKETINKTIFTHNLTDNNIQSTLIAYGILRNDSTTKDDDLLKMRNYFFEQRTSGYWRNTYESSKIMETIIPDLIKTGTNYEKPELIISGSMNDTIVKFPWQMTIKPSTTISIRKKGTSPIYFTAYQYYWDAHPMKTENDFKVRSYFNTKDSSTNLKAGENIKLIVELQVLEDADYVMLDIPIPAGCSYGNKKNNLPNEVHREYRKNTTNIYCQKLNRGNYKFEIELLARYTGSYTLNPAKAELMYFPTFFANTEIKKVRIK